MIIFLTWNTACKLGYKGCENRPLKKENRKGTSTIKSWSKTDIHSICKVNDKICYAQNLTADAMKQDEDKTDESSLLHYHFATFRIRSSFFVLSYGAAYQVSFWSSKSSRRPF
ncbi:hypothetical protein AVEN_80065-1 [Araneus ventricosus]|uniref:Uncharacterized protein n=1 Tax=Araneus ventricosus TaxID=182803 RepID=A0A4Y2T047_ARAVE|nr:hypothetical protein AVEN_80065-1 [Araneus ventricosus]